MLILKNLILQEKKKNENMLNAYRKELKKLPKGKIICKNINGREYYYLSYREGKKVISKYVGKKSADISPINELINRRYQIERIIKKLELENSKIKKMEMII